ncbi:SH3 domain-containing protein [Mesorhizobium sp. NBSH29]|nr:SH3 domain-containing protein [Mesorhizobium sp. NBSH29]
MSTMIVLLGLAIPSIASAAQAYVTGNVNVRSGPGTGYARITTLPAGARVTIRTCQRNWCQISRSGLRGWMSANYLDRAYSGRPVVVQRPIIVNPPYYRPHRPRPPHARPPGNRPPHVRPPNRPRPPGAGRPPRPGANCRIAPGFPCPR